MRFFICLLKKESGAAAAEYALMLAIFGVALSTAVLALGGDLSSAYSKAGTILVSISF